MLIAFRRSLSRLALLVLAGLPVATSLAGQTGPDLTPARITAPSEAGVGDSVALWVVAANAGTRDVASGWTLRVYQGNSTTASTSGTLVGTATWPRIIRAASGDSIRVIATIPASTPPGTYYFSVMLDAGRAISESNETNNLRASTTALAARSRWDVTVGAATMPDSLVKGSTLGLTIPLRNLGTGTVPAGWLGRVYLSTDASFGSDDAYLGDFTVAQAIAAGATLSLPLSYPSAATTGVYRLLVIADANNNLGESAEGNNIIASDKTVTIWERYVDLDGQLSGVPATAYSASNPNVGESFPVTVTVRNLGTVEVAGGWDVRLFLSSNNNIWGSVENPQDQPLASYVETRPIPAGGAISKAVTVSLPAGLVQTQWYIGLKLDTDNKVDEGGPAAGLSDAPLYRGGGNNERAAPFTVTGLPNLISPSAAAVVPLLPGTPGKFTVTTTNVGPGAAPGGWRGNFCLYGPIGGWVPPSVQRTVDCSPTLDSKGSFEVTSRLAAGASSTQSFEYLLPYNLWPGAYAVKGLLDAGSIIPETNENDNWAGLGGFPIQTLFDLEPVDIQWPSALAPGSTSAAIAVTVRNNGPKVVPPGILRLPDVPAGWNMRVKLSPTPGDKSTWVDAALYSGSTEPYLAPVNKLISNIITIGGIRPGDFVILVLDPENWVPEENEDNNTLVSKTPILPLASPNLQTTSARAETVLEPGRTATVSLTISNSGTGTAPAGWRAAACLTSVTATSECDPATAPLGSADIGTSLAPGTSTTQRIDLTLPTQLWPGQYRLRSMLDAGNAVAETNEPDNLASQDGFTVQSRFDFQPTYITWDAAPPASSTSATVVVVVRSNGLTVPSQAAWRIGVRLSPTPADASTWRDGGPGLSLSLKNIIGETPLQVPVAYFRPGDFVIILIDQDNSIPEFNEANNTLVSSTPIIPPGG